MGRPGLSHVPRRPVAGWEEAERIVNPQRRDPLLLAKRERVEKRLSGGLAHFLHHRVGDGEIGGDDAGAHDSVMQFEDPKLKHFFAGGGVLPMLDDAGHGMSLEGR